MGVSLKKRHEEGDTIAIDKQWRSGRLGMSLFLDLHPTWCAVWYQRTARLKPIPRWMGSPMHHRPETLVQWDFAQEKIWPRLKGELASSHTELDCPECGTGVFLVLSFMSACAWA